MSKLPEDMVDERIARMAELTRRYLQSPEGRARMRDDLRSMRRCAVADMSPAAVDARIRRVAALRRLCLSLGQASC